MSQIAYYRVSTNSLSIDAQRSAVSQASSLIRNSSDEGISGSTPA